MVWIFITTVGAAIFVAAILLLRFVGIGRPGSATSQTAGLPVRPSGKAVRLTRKERAELLANVRSAAQANAGRSAEIIRSWLDSDEKRDS